MRPRPRQARRELSNLARSQNNNAERITPAVEGFAFPDRDTRFLEKIITGRQHDNTITGLRLTFC